MKKLILAVASLALISSSAIAQEMIKSTPSDQSSSEPQADVPGDMKFGLYEVDPMTTASTGMNDMDAAAPVPGNYDGTVTQRDLHR